MGRIVVGTSSWADPGFVEEWYPAGLAQQELLPWYAEHFDGVEVNSTWYAVPSKKVVERWAQITPDDFSFDVKLHKAMTRHSAELEMLPVALRDDLAYLRLHGRNHKGWTRGRSVAERFAYRYSDKELKEVDRRAERLAERVPNVRMMFNNNRGSDAPESAQRARELLGQAVRS